MKEAIKYIIYWKKLKVLYGNSIEEGYYNMKMIRWWTERNQDKLIRTAVKQYRPVKHRLVKTNKGELTII